MEHLRALAKFIIFIATICCYFLILGFLFPIFLVSPNLIRPLLIKLVSLFSRFALVLFGINIEHLELRHDLKAKSGRLLVSNHMSYLDVIILASIYPSCFVTSVEIKKTFFLGQLCRLGGCLFVERRNRRFLSQEILELTNALRAGVTVCIFPEATSTNGDHVLRFKKPLFQSAIDAHVEVQPVTINYLRLDDQQVCDLNRDSLCWYGEMTFLGHFYQFLKRSSVKIQVIHHPFIHPKEVQGVDDLSILSHQLVSSAFRSLSFSPKKRGVLSGLDTLSMVD